MGNNFKKILIFSLWLIIFLVLLKNSFNYLDPDLGWHLTVGKQITAEGSVPGAEYYNYPLLGYEWVDHEWLLNALTYIIYDRSGYFSLNVFFALLVMLVLLVARKLILVRYPSCDDRLIALVFLGGVLSARPSLGIRLQEFSLLFTAVLFLIIELSLKEQPFQTNNIKFFYAAPALFWIWANSHGSFILGLGLYLAYLILISFPLFWNKVLIKLKIFRPLPGVTWPDKLSLWLLFMISAVATLLTPYGFKLYGLLGDYSGTFYFSHILEWLPAWKPPIIPWQIIYAAIAVCLFMITALNLKNAAKKIDPWHFFLGLFFLALAAKSRRHFPLFFIASLPIMVQFFASLEKPPPNWLEGAFVRNFIRLYAVLGLVLGSALILLTTNFTNTPLANQKFCADLPCDAVNFLRSGRLENTVFFNPYHWGGFLSWAWPEKLLFIDGRFPQLPYKEHSYLEEYFAVMEKDRVKDKLDEYKIDLIMLSLAQPFTPGWIERYVFGYDKNYYRDPNAEIIEYLDSATEWELIYNDGISMVYLLE